jgi:P4 family phage/plasmid primase-like protien
VPGASQSLGSISIIKGLCFLKLISLDLFDISFSTSINNYEDVLPIHEGKKINLRTLEITDRTIEDRFDHELGVNYTQDEKELEVIENLILEIMGIHVDNMEEYPNHDAVTEKNAFQVILGYMISGCNKEKMYTVWHGPSGNNGKSTLASIITGVFGVYSKSFDKSIIEQVNKSKGNSHNSALIATKGVHIGFIHETEAQMPISSADIKALTSGGQDTISTRECRGKQEEFLPRFKLAILCNKKPKINGSDPALASRTRYIPFLNKFENSSENIKKIDNIKNNFKDAFFSWCVNGSKKYFDTGVLPKTDLQKTGEQQFIQENDTLQSFINEFCNVGEFTLDSEGNPTQYKARYKCSDFKKDFLQQYPDCQVKELAQDLLSKNKKFKPTTIRGYSYYNFISKKVIVDTSNENVNPMLDFQ